VFQAIAMAEQTIRPVYLIVWMDGIVLKLENSKINNKTIYLTVGLNRRQEKKCSEIWLSKNESTSFLSRSFNRFKARGVEDMITATDNLNGFTKTIKTHSQNHKLKFV
jgi:transposase-like protein